MEEKDIRQIIREELERYFQKVGIKKYMSTEDKARQIGITPEALRRKARRGEIPCEKIGSGSRARYRFMI